MGVGIKPAISSLKSLEAAIALNQRMWHRNHSDSPKQVCWQEHLFTSWTCSLVCHTVDPLLPLSSLFLMALDLQPGVGPSARLPLSCERYVSLRPSVSAATHRLSSFWSDASRHMDSWTRLVPRPPRSQQSVPGAQVLTPDLETHTPAPTHTPIPDELVWCLRVTVTDVSRFSLRSRS